MAQILDWHHAGLVLSAGGSDKHVELKAEAWGACESSAANKAAEHIVVALRSSVAAAACGRCLNTAPCGGRCPHATF